MAVEIVGGLERKKRGDPHDDWVEEPIADVKVVVREATPPPVLMLLKMK